MSSPSSLPPAQSLELAPGITYTYHYTPPLTPSHHTLLFLHGFPSSPSDFASQITHFSSLGHGTLTPSLLGYPGTSSPLGVTDYTWRPMCAHLATLIANVIPKGSTHGIIAVAHDLGSWMLSRFMHLHPSILSGVVFLNVGYSVPGQRFDVAEINRITAEMTGEAKFGYWDVLTAEDGMRFCDTDPASLLSLMYADPSTMASNLGPSNATRTWLTAHHHAPLPPWLPQSAFDAKVTAFTHNGFTGPLNWYKALARNASWDDEEHMRREIEVPVLLVCSGKDEMTLPEVQEGMTVPWCGKKGVRVETLEVGHWIMLERAGEVNKLVEEFVLGLE